MDIQLPKVVSLVYKQEEKKKSSNYFYQKSSKTLTLDIGTDRVALSTRSNIYYLDIWLPIDIDSDECGAQFDKATHVNIYFIKN